MKAFLLAILIALVVPAVALAEANGTAFEVVKTFANVDPGNNCG